MKKRKKLFYIIEILLSIIIFGILIIGVMFIWNYRKNAISDKELIGNLIWDSNKVEILEGKDKNKIAVYNLNPSDSFNVYRIVVIGDSVVYTGCPSVDIIEEKLNKNIDMLKIGKRTIKKFNVVNAAYPSNIGGILNRLQIIRENDIRIDMLFVLSGWNEHWYDSSTNPCVKIGCYRDLKTYRWLLNLTKSDNKIIKNLATKAFLYKRDKEYIYCEELFEENPEEFLIGLDHYNTSIYRVNLDSYEERLIDMIKSARGEGTEIIIVTPPDALIEGIVPEISLKDCSLIDNNSYFEVHHLYVNKAREIANEYKVPILDLDRLFEKIPNYKILLFNNASYDPIHPNSLGNDYCTEFYYKKIILTLLRNSNGASSG